MNWVFIVFCLKFTAGSDYENVTAELTFSAGPTLTQCVNITIFQDSTVESLAEFFTIQVATSNSGVTLSPTSGMLNVVIQEDMDRKSQHTPYLQTSL